MQRFDGKVVLVSGAAQGIGFATAEQFAREGAVVIVTDKDIQLAKQSVVSLFDAGLKVEAESLDVTQESDWDRVVDGICQRHQRLDVLVNNAGVVFTGSVEDITLDDWRMTMAVNVEGVFIGTRKAISVMKSSRGAIVNVASISANVGDGPIAAYNTSKGGVRLFTKSAALHCASQGYNIRINSVHPGHTMTRLVTGVIDSFSGQERENFVERMTAMIPMRRAADPQEIAKPIVFLASDDASYMTGSELIVDGGYTAA